jgi:hypothetical protein
MNDYIHYFYPAYRYSRMVTSEEWIYAINCMAKCSEAYFHQLEMYDIRKEPCWCRSHLTFNDYYLVPISKEVKDTINKRKKGIFATCKVSLRSGRELDHNLYSYMANVIKSCHELHLHSGFQIEVPNEYMIDNPSCKCMKTLFKDGFIFAKT